MAVISQLSITTASVGAGVTLAPAAVAWVKSAIITKVKVTPSIAASSFELWIYEEAARTNIVYHAKAVTASPYFDPVQNDTDVITEVRRGAVATIENQDSLAEFIYSIKNNDSQAKTYTILIDYIALSTLASDIQDTITRLSTIVAGIWNGTLISPQYGGTGQSFQASSGVVSINAGTFISNNVLTASQILYGATGNTIASASGLTFDGTTLLTGTLVNQRAGARLFAGANTTFVAVIDNSSGTAGDYGLEVGRAVVDAAGLINFVSDLTARTQLGSITRNAGTSAVLYNTSSDRRRKEHIGDTVRGLRQLLSLAVRDFNFIGDDPVKGRMQGFIAQEIHTIYPEAVSPGGEDVESAPWSMDYGRITPLIVKAIQELVALLKITDL